MHHVARANQYRDCLLNNVVSHRSPNLWRPLLVARDVDSSIQCHQVALAMYKFYLLLNVFRWRRLALVEWRRPEKDEEATQ